MSISTERLTIANGAEIGGESSGQGNAGNITINATDSINLQDDTSQTSFRAAIKSDISPNATGNGGDITITTSNLNFISDAIITAQTRGQGNAGNIEITTDNLRLESGSDIDVSTFGSGGNAGNITIDASQDIAIDGEDAFLSRASGIRSSTFFNSADSGNIDITANNLTLSNGGTISTGVSGEGNAGNINVDVAENTIIEGQTSEGRVSDINSEVIPGAEGDAGDINLTTANLSLIDGGSISSTTLGKGDAGNINITATENITIEGKSEEARNELPPPFGTETIPSTGSSIISETGNISLINSDFEAEGNGGELNISAANLTLSNGGEISSASDVSTGDAGNINIVATENILIDGVSSSFSSQAGVGSGNGGAIDISTTNLTLSDGGELIATVRNSQGSAGNIDITATESVNVDGKVNSMRTFLPSLISSQNDFTGAAGNSGEINISTAKVNLTNGGRIATATSSVGDAGDVNINAADSIKISGLSAPFNLAFPDSLTPESFLGLPSGIISGATSDSGNGGDVNLATDQLAIADGGVVEVSNFTTFARDNNPGTGRTGNLTIAANSIALTDNARIEAVTLFAGGESGIINLNIAEDLILQNGSSISARALENANGGNVNINANNGFILAFSNQDNDIIADAAQGNGGNININTQAIFGLEERTSAPFNQTNDIDASSEFGLQGDFSLNTPDFDPTTGLIELPVSVGDASDQISQNPCQQGAGSEFIVTGKGGLPLNPNGSLGSSEVEVGLVEPSLRTPSLSPAKKGEQDKQGEDTETVQTKALSSEVESVPAQGWIVNDKGEVTLTAIALNDERKNRGEISGTACSRTNE